MRTCAVCATKRDPTGFPLMKLARVEWIAKPSMNVVPLCADCYGVWQATAEQEPDLGPAFIWPLP